jgi:hypothetical protein
MHREHDRRQRDRDVRERGPERRARSGAAEVQKNLVEMRLENSATAFIASPRTANSAGVQKIAGCPRAVS